MDIIDAFVAEHAVFRVQLDELERTVNRLGTVEQLQAQFAIVAAGLLTHAKLEDELLFNPFNTKLDIDAVRSEHEMIERLVAGVARQDDESELQDLLSQTIQSQRRHFESEEKAVFAGARRVLSDDELTSLGEEYAIRRNIGLRR